MKLKIAWIGKTKDPAIGSLTSDYLKRIARYAEVEGLALPNEAALIKLLAKRGSRVAPRVVLLDSGGMQLSSEEFAQFLEKHQDRSPQPLLLAVGSADGFTHGTRNSASAVLSLGRMTLAHELARVVLLEQVYRAFTIMKGHPYHTGHRV